MAVFGMQLVGNNEPIKVDEASLTGESLAVTKSPGDEILSGAVVEQGESEAVVTAVGANTFFGRTITLLSRPEEKGHLQQVSFPLHTPPNDRNPDEGNDSHEGPLARNGKTNPTELIDFGMHVYAWIWLEGSI